MNKVAKCMLLLMLALTMAVLPVVAMAAAVATIERTGSVEEFDTLEEALDSAKSGETVKLVSDYTLNTHIGLKVPVVLGAKLTISGSVSIDGNNKTITRDPDYTGTLFNVATGNALELKNLTIDGGNNYTFDTAAYETDLENMTQIAKADAEKYFTPEDGAPVASKYMMTVGGKLNLNNVTIKNHYSIGSGLVSASNGADVTLTDTEITHCASTQGSGLVVNASGGKYEPSANVITVTMNEGTVIDGNHVGGNHGIFKIYLGTTFNMNGGEIKNTTGWNSNGSAVGVYWATFNMNGGKICSNSSVYGPSNGRNAAIYLHSNSQFVMNDGTVCCNQGRARGGIDAPYSAEEENGSRVTISGGKVIDNISIVGNENKDIYGGMWLTINGGEFTQDVTQWCADGFGTYEDPTGVFNVMPINQIPTPTPTATPTETPAPEVTPVPDTSDLPKTGDNSNITLFAMLLIMSSACLLFMRRKVTER